MSLRLRLTGWYLLLLGVILGLFSLGIYLSLAYALRSQLDESLRTVAHLLLEEIHVENGGVTAHFDALPAGLQVAFYDPKLRFSNASFPEAAVCEPGFRTVGPWRQLTVPVGGTPAWVVVQRAEEQALLSQLLVRLLVGVPLTLLVTVGGGWFLASRALRPIDEVTRAAAAIGAAPDLRQRLRPVVEQDELGRLVATFNGMLERLAESFARQRHFTTDAAHQLRTPLAVIRGRAEVTLKRPRSASEYEEALREVFRQSDHMTSLVGKLMRLARGDAGVPLDLESLDLSEVAGYVAELSRDRALASGVELRVGPLEPAQVRADQTGVTELVLNLVDNALKFTPSGGTVTVSAGPGFVRVCDTGCGIEAGQLEAIFQRFHRLDAGVDGTGLGLAICRAVARQHGGEIVVESEVGKGSCFTFLLPVLESYDLV